MNAPTTFNLNGIEYRISKLNAFAQLHLSRRLAPVVPTLLPVFVKLAKSNGKLADDLMSLPEVVQPFCDAIGAMSDENAEYIFGTALSVVTRQTTVGTFAPVWSTKMKTCMFDDLDIGSMTQLVMQVTVDSLGPFIRGLLTSQQSNPATTADDS